MNDILFLKAVFVKGCSGAVMILLCLFELQARFIQCLGLVDWRKLLKHIKVLFSRYDGWLTARLSLQVGSG